MRDEQPRSTSPMLSNMPAPKAALQRNPEGIVNRRAQNKSIQFNRLPSYMQKKYFELFRPKELQDMITHGGAKKTTTTTAPAKGQNGDLEKPTEHEALSKRETSPSLVRTRPSKQFRQRRIVIGGQTKESNLTNLLKNVNFFRAEKQLLNSKGLKYGKVGGPVSKMQQGETFDPQPIEPIACEPSSALASLTRQPGPRTVQK